MTRWKMSYLFRLRILPLTAKRLRSSVPMPLQSVVNWLSCPFLASKESVYVPNIFFDRIGTGLHRLGSELARNIILVSRLDAPTPAQVRRMIDDSLAAEKNRLAGLAVIDTRDINDEKAVFMRAMSGSAMRARCCCGTVGQ